MKERPILFNGDMVRAILSGEKTQTRRMVKYIPSLGGPDAWCNKKDCPETVYTIGDYRRFCPFGQVGDRLWVRESFAKADKGENNIAYRADEYADSFRWTPSIHMPRWASRITLEIVGVRVERLQDVTDAEARAEGFKDVGAFADCWNSIYKNWHENPWVWVVEFKHVEAM